MSNNIDETYTTVGTAGLFRWWISVCGLVSSASGNLDGNYTGPSQAR